MLSRLQTVFDWLVDGAPDAKTPMDVIARMNPALVDAGVPVERCEAFVRTLHPHIAGRSFLWTPGAPVSVIERTFSYLNSDEFQRGVVGEVFRSGKVSHIKDGGDGFTSLLAAPLLFKSGQVHAVTFGTRQPGGFSDDDVNGILHVVRPLARVGEILALARTATNLLNTYVGRNAGEQILAGQVQRGDTTLIPAVIFFSDLRGFTSMSTTMEPGEIIKVLNDLFECQVPAIEKHGGEVLKFMGDGLLAIFPFAPDGAGAASACDRALDAVSESHKSLAVLNERRAAKEQAPVRFGVGLHVGEVAYGNIGGAGRLDFTCIGAAVNLASRIEGLTSKLGRDVVTSEKFATMTTRKMDRVGEAELKGVAGAVAVFAPSTLK
ncbi:MAG: adenylate/guanylate cyclase domain-containing protein [Deltaproteobacteria bacterium]|nr:adenylate/guanylate cyclase domain-containing protein [Deltaproteobacteria bacterium]